jgi:hypothetical protein
MYRTLYANAASTLERCWSLMRGTLEARALEDNIELQHNDRHASCADLVSVVRYHSYLQPSARSQSTR